MKSILLLSILFFNTFLFATFEFSSCSGEGSFSQHIQAYRGDYDKSIVVDTLPAGIEGLYIEVLSEKDIDIRLFGPNNEKIIHWPSGQIHSATQETIAYQQSRLTYSGYNGTSGHRGNEFIQIEGTTPTPLRMEVFGYEEGDAIINYTWAGKKSCTPEVKGKGSFKQDIRKNQTSFVGTIPAQLENVEINLTSSEDIDIQFYAADGTAIVSWKPKGLLSGESAQSIDYHGMHIEWSGYHGVAGKKGHEYIRIIGMTTEYLTMKVYGYEAGTADVRYAWGALPDPTGNYILAEGETCPQDSIPISIQDVRKHKDFFCNKINQWGIVRLSDNASLSGTRYHCEIKSNDSRTMGESLCQSTVKSVKEEVKIVEGTLCPSNYIYVNKEEVQANKEEICSMIPKWGITRLSNGASLSGTGYGCIIKENDTGTLGESVCKKVHLFPSQSCESGYHPLTIRDINENNNVCNMISEWSIVRLAGQASYKGSGYGCTTEAYDLGQLGEVLCKGLKEETNSNHNTEKKQLKVAYVETNSYDIADVGCYLDEENKPLFDIAVIFAGNINANTSSGKAEVSLNSTIEILLDENINKTKALQSQGIKVLLDILGNHQNAGWSCFENVSDAKAFATNLSAVVTRYGLDGIDIDDEYSKCNNEYENSLVTVVTEFKKRMPNKIISKALFRDTEYFLPSYEGKRLGEVLDYGWEMSYWDGSCNRINSYKENGMTANKLGVGVSVSSTSLGTAQGLLSCTEEQGLAFMVFNVNQNSLPFLNGLWKDVHATQSCFENN